MKSSFFRSLRMSFSCITIQPSLPVLPATLLDDSPFFAYLLDGFKHTVDGKRDNGNASDRTYNPMLFQERLYVELVHLEWSGILIIHT